MRRHRNLKIVSPQSQKNWFEAAGIRPSALRSHLKRFHQSKDSNHGIWNYFSSLFTWFPVKRLKFFKYLKNTFLQRFELFLSSRLTGVICLSSSTTKSRSYSKRKWPLILVLTFLGLSNRWSYRLNPKTQLILVSDFICP